MKLYNNHTHPEKWGIIMYHLKFVLTCDSIQF